MKLKFYRFTVRAVLSLVISYYHCWRRLITNPNRILGAARDILCNAFALRTIVAYDTVILLVSVLSISLSIVSIVGVSSRSRHTTNVTSEATAKRVRPQVLEGHTEMVTALNFSPRGDLLASASYDFTVVIWGWPLESGSRHKPLHKIQAHDAYVNSVRLVSTIVLTIDSTF